MQGDLTLTISERLNGVKWTYRLSLVRKEAFSSFMNADYITNLLRGECISLGYRLRIDGKTSCISRKSGLKIV